MFSSRNNDVLKRIKMTHRSICMENPLLDKRYIWDEYEFTFMNGYILKGSFGEGHYIFVGMYSILAEFDNTIHLFNFNESYTIINDSSSEDIFSQRIIFIAIQRYRIDAESAVEYKSTLFILHKQHTIYSIVVLISNVRHVLHGYGIHEAN